MRIVVFDVWDLPNAIATYILKFAIFPGFVHDCEHPISDRDFRRTPPLGGDLLFGVIGFRIRLLNRLRIGGTRQEPNGVSRLNESAHQHAGRNSHGIKTMKVS